MNCLIARDRLPELALALVSAPEREAVESHLASCAACRKESSELVEATAVVGFSAASANPPEELGGRVVRAVRRRARGARSEHRTWRIAVAAALIVGVLGASGIWSSIARDAQPQAEVQSIVSNDEKAYIRWRETIQDLIPFPDPDSRPRFAQLVAPESSLTGEGWAFVMAGPEDTSYVALHVAGLDMSKSTWPLEVWLADPTGEERHLAGRIRRGRVDESGSVDFAEQTDRGLTRLRKVVVRDASGVTVLVGNLFPGEL